MIVWCVMTFYLCTFFLGFFFMVDGTEIILCPGANLFRWTVHKYYSLKMNSFISQFQYSFSSWFHIADSLLI